MVRCGSKNGHYKRHVSKIDWTTCSKFANHPLIILDSIVIIIIIIIMKRDLYDHVTNEHKNLHFDNE